MNIFVLAWNVIVCASYYFDCHLNKIIIEIAQLLSSAKRILDNSTVDLANLTLSNLQDNNTKYYQVTHKSHPVAIWMRESKANFDWSISLAEELQKEWQYRNNHMKEHKCMEIIRWLRDNPPLRFETDSDVMTPFRLAIAYKECIVENDVVQSYRNYYQHPSKQEFASWKKRGIPDWYIINPDYFQKRLTAGGGFKRKPVKETKKRMRKQDVQ